MERSGNPQIGTGRGQMRLTIERVAEESVVTSAFASNPLKLLTPRARGSSVWAYLSSYGGGMVSGDVNQLDVRLGSRAVGFFGTQASTKVYRCPNEQPCVQTARVEIGPNAVLVWAPDPVQAFAGAVYRQVQDFRLGAGSGLVLLDAFTSGRAERGERWAFAEYRSRNEIWAEGTRRVLDSVYLRSELDPLGSAGRMGRYQAIALLLFMGLPLAPVARRTLESIGSRPVIRRAPVALSASPVAGGTLVRVAGERTEDVRSEVVRLLAFLPELLGDDPFIRKW